MKTVNISLPESLAQLVTQEVRRGSYASISEFFRNILRNYLSEQGKKEEGLVFEEFDAQPLEKIRRSFEQTGLYNKKFIDGLIKGLAKSSPYVPKTSKS
ncbi:MAG: hypothetical protein A2Z24_02500 [Candidatus Woykebacteria bacterium RBG_16_44_10]|uniref:Ribbon-helix-helix protein CopG domain-containing protein n=1 Tax=Candidatus Woykebacteria bacterium RBG_16_44_10 TaxID=1802597 RepID=A0A1G1WE36_9BACT|nr:MAG: hypothetical protein A2Z24_02500 [Candidatus Woykebacteria bacterium RBG_16_44_10]